MGMSLAAPGQLWERVRPSTTQPGHVRELPTIRSVCFSAAVLNVSPCPCCTPILASFWLSCLILLPSAHVCPKAASCPRLPSSLQPSPKSSLYPSGSRPGLGDGGVPLSLLGDAIPSPFHFPGDFEAAALGETHAVAMFPGFLK